MFTLARNGLSDIRAGIQLRRVWMALAREDIDDQHRRTTLGPIWMMLNYLIYIGTFVLIFGGQAPIPNFLAYISIGMLVFMFLQDVMVRSVNLFEQEKAFISGTTLPLTVYVLRMAAQHAIRTGYAALGCVAILLITGTPVTMNWLWSLLGIIEIAAVTIPTIILFAITGAFFPDLQFIITNIVRVGMFLTPIFWVTTAGSREYLSTYNPLTYFIDAVRAPIVTDRVPEATFLVCGAIIVASWVAAILLLGRYRREIVFVL